MQKQYNSTGASTAASDELPLCYLESELPHILRWQLLGDRQPHNILNICLFTYILYFYGGVAAIQQTQCFRGEEEPDYIISLGLYDNQVWEWCSEKRIVYYPGREQRWKRCDSAATEWHDENSLAFYKRWCAASSLIGVGRSFHHLRGLRPMTDDQPVICGGKCSD